MEILPYNNHKPKDDNVYKPLHKRQKQEEKNQTEENLQSSKPLLPAQAKLITSHDLCGGTRFTRISDLRKSIHTEIRRSRNFNAKAGPQKQSNFRVMPHPMELADLKTRDYHETNPKSCDKEAASLDVISFEKIQMHLNMFDELIRQCTLSCTKQGELMLLIRNEFLRHLHHFQNMYSSLVAVVWRKLLQKRKSSKRMKEKIVDIKEEIGKLKAEQIEFIKSAARHYQTLSQDELQETQEYNDELGPMLAKREKLKQFLITSVKGFPPMPQDEQMQI